MLIFYENNWGPRIQTLASEVMWVSAVLNSSTVCVSQDLQSAATSCYFRKQESIILLILQLDCWCFQQSRGQFLCNDSCGWNGKMTKYFCSLQFRDCSRGRCGFSNWRYTLLLFAAVSSIPWYSLSLCVPLLGSRGYWKWKNCTPCLYRLEFL